ncbi:hypothetical protein KHF85_16055 [Xanthomonas translucens pv. graminis]|uniref:Uncharacterized protein n=1 Tax=Xanthomonas campestris pv. translucens TaxID=343 RepID=A0A120EVY4_XANCT|nr:hypothetical protein [Xanthomonas translucens]KWV12007.1 hypothetical protein ATB53_18355 [Xanthomonas translucens]WIH04293.1 hypothetical protein KHF85_16055 [Xanthomonas translucens pv. graminis]
MFIRHIQLWRVLAQLVQMLAGAYPTRIRPPLAFGGVVHVVGQPRHLADVIKLLELRCLLLRLRIVARAQLVEEFTLLLVFGKARHLKFPSSVVNQSNGMSFSS